MSEWKNKNFPLDIVDIEQNTAEELLSYFKGEYKGFIRVGPKGYCMPKMFEQEAADIYSMPIKQSDTFVVTFPRSGTTWTQELVWLLLNDLDYAKAAQIPLVHRFPFLEMSILINPVNRRRILEENPDRADFLTNNIRGIAAPATERIGKMPSPRFIKSHLPLSLLPPNLLDTAKVVFVARDPRDVAVSFYHHNRLFRTHEYVGDFKRYWNYFINDLICWTPYFEYIKEGWEKRNNENMLFLFYEELSKDLPAIIRRVGEFFDKHLTEKQIQRLCEHLSIDNFKNNKSVNDETFKEAGLIITGEAEFIRKGKAGGWRDHFDAEMTQQAERWMEENLRDTDLRFPQ